LKGNVTGAPPLVFGTRRKPVRFLVFGGGGAIAVLLLFCHESQGELFHIFLNF
jgi:hypothetical protein